MSTILIFSRKDDIHADMVIKYLSRGESQYFRINTDYPEDYEFCLALNGSSFIVNRNTSNRIDLSNVDSLWLRRRSIPRFNYPDQNILAFVQSEWTAFYRNIMCVINPNSLWVNHPVNLDRARDKIQQLTIANSLGFLIPETLLTNSVNPLQNMMIDGCQFVYKPHDVGHLPEGSDKKLHTSLIDPVLFKDPTSFEKMLVCPGIYQKYIDKDYELRVNVVGEDVFAVRIFSQENQESKIDWRRFDFSAQKHEVVKIDNFFAKQCLSLVMNFGLKFAAIDFVVDKKGDTYFLEVNANGQWAWIELLTKQPLAKAIANLLAKK